MVPGGMGCPGCKGVATMLLGCPGVPCCGVVLVVLGRVLGLFCITDVGVVIVLVEVDPLG